MQFRPLCWLSIWTCADITLRCLLIPYLVYCETEPSHLLVLQWPHTLTRGALAETGQSLGLGYPEPTNSKDCSILGRHRAESKSQGSNHECGHVLCMYLPSYPSARLRKFTCETACIHERETAYMLLWCCDVGRAHI